MQASKEEKLSAPYPFEWELKPEWNRAIRPFPFEPAVCENNLW